MGRKVILDEGQKSSKREVEIERETELCKTEKCISQETIAPQPARGRK